jgi:hypothetical protein
MLLMPFGDTRRDALGAAQTPCLTGVWRQHWVQPQEAITRRK